MTGKDVKQTGCGKVRGIILELIWRSEVNLRHSLFRQEVENCTAKKWSKRDAGYNACVDELSITLNSIYSCRHWQQLDKSNIW
jgi:hypothetical protein